MPPLKGLRATFACPRACEVRSIAAKASTDESPPTADASAPRSTRAPSRTSFKSLLGGSSSSLARAGGGSALFTCCGPLVMFACPAWTNARVLNGGQNLERPHLLGLSPEPQTKELGEVVKGLRAKRHPSEPVIEPVQREHVRDERLGRRASEVAVSCATSALSSSPGSSRRRRSVTAAPTLGQREARATVRSGDSPGSRTARTTLAGFCRRKRCDGLRGGDIAASRAST